MIKKIYRKRNLVKYFNFKTLKLYLNFYVFLIKKLPFITEKPKKMTFYRKNIVQGTNYVKIY